MEALRRLKCPSVLKESLSDRRTLFSLALGQAISLLVTGTGVTSQYLASNEGVSVPSLQNSINYWLLFICYFGYFIYLRHGPTSQTNSTSTTENAEAPPEQTEIEDTSEKTTESLLNSNNSETPKSNENEDDILNSSEMGVIQTYESLGAKPGLGETLRVKGWFYLLLALADVEANYLVVKAYNYTSITSVMLLDCFTIPCVMVLSFIFLKTRFRFVHYLGVVLCLMGLGILVATDYIYNEHEGGDNTIKGDLLCLAGAFLYGVSNVGQEKMVKQFDRIEYLAMLGLFGSIISSMQLLILERDELFSISWSVTVVALMLGFGLCLFSVYSLVPYMLQWSGATMFNLSLLSSDAFAIIAGIFLFSYTPSVFYFIALVVIIVGLILYNLRLSIECCKVRWCMNET